jgi:hypothetical protein
LNYPGQRRPTNPHFATNAYLQLKFVRLEEYKGSYLRRIETETRNKCVICGQVSLENQLVVEAFPVYMGCVLNQESSEDFVANQVWATCQGCSTLQLRELVPLNILYQANHNDAIGSTWRSHVEELVIFASIFNGSRQILEIGGADGKLAQEYLNRNPESNYTIVEPNFLGKANNFQVVEDYIENQLDLVSESDLVIHSHVLEHLYQPVATMAAVSKKMAFGSKMIVSFPNLERIMQSGGANSLNFEHTYFLSNASLEVFFSNLGLRLISRRFFREHSVFMALEKTSRCEEGKFAFFKNQNMSDEFRLLWRRLERVARAFNEVSSKQDPDHTKSFIFGAHIFAQALISVGLNETLCVAILDNSPLKLANRLYGSSLYVQHPEVIRSLDRPIVAVVASHFQSEIKSQLLSINPSTTIIEA